MRERQACVQCKHQTGSPLPKGKKGQHVKAMWVRRSWDKHLPCGYAFTLQDSILGTAQVDH